jgi:2-(1,2-epoxy-1,2-dihydrophenyl)acetyl-CoA isomerase
VEVENAMKNPDSILFTVDDGVARLTLNRPNTLNAINPGMMRAISAAMSAVRDDLSIRVVIITGAGRGFCAGADLGDVARGQPVSTDAGQSANENGSLYNDTMRAIADCPVPTIARVNGAAAGGGFGLALACDISIAGDSAFFIATFGPRLGIVPDLGTTWNLPVRAGRARALGISLLGERITAAQAAAWGLIWKSVADDVLDAEVDRIAGILKRSSPSAATRIRSSTDAAFRHSFSEQLDLEMVHQAVLIPRNMQEGARAFMNKREPQFGGERG